MKNIIAIGRSKYLYDTIQLLNKNNFIIHAIITQKPNDEYEIGIDDFRSLASNIGCDFYNDDDNNLESIINIILKKKNIDIGISVNWRFKIEKKLIKKIKYGILNFHLGNLPDYKGNATPNWSILNNEKFIYCNIHKMENKLDSGDIIARKKILIKPRTYIGDILNEAENIAPKLFLDSLKSLIKNSKYYKIKGSVDGIRCFPRNSNDGRIKWNNSAFDILKLIRATSTPFNGAYCFYNDKKIKIWKASIRKLNQKIYAMPGQVIDFNLRSGHVTINCGIDFLDIELISYEEMKMVNPIKVIKGIRKRLE